MVQTLIVWSIVGIAVWHVGRHLYRMVRGALDARAGCGTGACGNCEAAPKGETAVAGFVSISEIAIH